MKVRRTGEWPTEGKDKVEERRAHREELLVLRVLGPGAELPRVSLSYVDVKAPTISMVVFPSQTSLYDP
jgi:hypothetical protein